MGVFNIRGGGGFNIRGRGLSRSQQDCTRKLSFWVPKAGVKGVGFKMVSGLGFRVGGLRSRSRCQWLNRTREPFRHLSPLPKPFPFSLPFIPL